MDSLGKVLSNMESEGTSGRRNNVVVCVSALLVTGLVIGWLVLHKQSQAPEPIPTTQQQIVDMAAPPPPATTPIVEVVTESMVPRALQDDPAAVKRKMPATMIVGKDKPELISFEHAAFFDLQRLARSMELMRPQKLSEVLFQIQQMTGASELAAAQLLEYVRDASRSVDAIMKQAKSETCSNRSQLHSIRVIADRMDKDDERVEARRVELVLGAQAIIGPDGMQRLRQHIDTKVRPSMVQQVGDTEAMLLALNKPPEEIVDRICGTLKVGE